MNPLDQVKALKLLQAWLELAKLLRDKQPGQNNNPVEVANRFRQLTKDTESFMEPIS